jgi:uroporphyrinogen-III decarboxylase
LFEDYKDDPEMAKAALSAAFKTIDAVASEIKAFTKSVGVGVSSAVRFHNPEIHLTSNCSCDMISEEDYREFVYPWDKRLSERRRPFGVHHCGGSMQRLAGAYASLSPDFIEIGAFSDISATLSRFPPSTMVNLRFSPRLLLQGAPEEIKREARRMKALSSHFPKTTMSVVGVDGKTPKANVEAFWEAASEDGHD